MRKIQVDSREEDVKEGVAGEGLFTHTPIRPRFYLIFAENLPNSQLAPKGPFPRLQNNRSLALFGRFALLWHQSIVTANKFSCSRHGRCPR